LIGALTEVIASERARTQLPRNIPQISLGVATDIAQIAWNLPSP
jgi:hypothetical protein